MYRTELKVVAQRFRLLQETLEQQQIVIDKQQKKLVRLQMERKVMRKQNVVPSTTQKESVGISTKGRAGNTSSASEKTSNPCSDDDEETRLEAEPDDTTTNEIPHNHHFMQKRQEEDIPVPQEKVPTTYKRKKRDSNEKSFVAITAETSAHNIRTSRDQDSRFQNERHTNNDERSALPYKYIEVVRKRDERLALPGHACEECEKYYAALGEGFEGQRDACSRHRAAWEPYSTPDDFWRLSFPDSTN
ncbi:DNA endonuclease rbbp8 [Aphanomyces cochlioides]|nr:DNA endonuclease rbbp8 [Aphanomyces cochlioides]